MTCLLVERVEPGYHMSVSTELVWRELAHLADQVLPPRRVVLRWACQLRCKMTSKVIYPGHSECYRVITVHDNISPDLVSTLLPV